MKVRKLEKRIRKLEKKLAKQRRMDAACERLGFSRLTFDDLRLDLNYTLVDGGTWWRYFVQDANGKRGDVARVYIPTDETTPTITLVGIAARADVNTDDLHADDLIGDLIIDIDGNEIGSYFLAPIYVPPTDRMAGRWEIYDNDEKHGSYAYYLGWVEGDDEDSPLSEITVWLYPELGAAPEVEVHSGSLHGVSERELIHWCASTWPDLGDRVQLLS